MYPSLKSNAPLSVSRTKGALPWYHLALPLFIRTAARSLRAIGRTRGGLLRRFASSSPLSTRRLHGSVPEVGFQQPAV